MNKIVICAAGGNAAMPYALRALVQRGIHIAEKPEADATHLLLPAPAFEADGRIRGGGVLEHILADLPQEITVVGGNLNHPALDGYKKLDLLTDGIYLAKNAAITADCAIRVAAGRLPIIWDGCPVLVLGWGRIGKCLAAQLRAAGAAVSVAARKKTDRDLLLGLGYGSEQPDKLRHGLAAYRVIFNTVPAPVLDAEQLRYCRKDCLKVELASSPGISGPDVISALGLPGKTVPESSGKLIAHSIIRMIAEKEAVR